MARQYSGEGVELNVTAMLDMAFQLLAFFILTFRPAPYEPAVLLHIPPTRPVVIGDGDNLGDTPVAPSSIQPAGINTLRINLFSASGGLDRMTINGFPAETFAVLRDQMRASLTDPGSPIEQIVVQASEALRDDEVMKVVDVPSGAEVAEDRQFCEVEPGGDVSEHHRQRPVTSGEERQEQRDDHALQGRIGAWPEAGMTTTPP